MVVRYDFIPIKAAISPEGWVRDRPVITRTGIFEYKTADGKVRREYRPDEEVFESNSLLSLAGVPVTDGHVGLVTASNHKGVIGTVISNGIKEDENVVADIIIHDTNRLGKRRDLSLGYVCELDETPGQTAKGEKYDAVQKNIRYNHLAVVQSGRAGNAKLRLDSADAVNGLFDLENEMDPKLVTVRFDNLEYVASPEVANRLAKYETDMVDLVKKRDELEAERDAFKASLDEAKAKADTATKHALSAAKARLKLEEVASKAGVKFDEDTSDRDIKVDVVTKIRGDAIKFDGKSDDYVNFAYDFAMTEQNDKDDKTGDQRKKLHDRKDQKDHDPDISSRAARERMIARIRNEKKDAA